MTSPASDLVAVDLHKAFGRQPVLTGLDLEVAAGTLTAILGPSGSGKTTLLRILAGFDRPDRGSVQIGDATVDGQNTHIPPEGRRIGYVSQEGSLFPHLSVQANVGFGLPRRQRGGAQVSDLLDAVGLTGLAGRYPHQLSGGQQQRVALARALAVRPRIVLLDEPFASLDAQLRANVRADVQAILREARTTAILVTHDQDEALSIADTVAVIREGRIAQCGPPEDLYGHPVDADLAAFIGAANVIDGVADGEMVTTALGRFSTRRLGDPLSRSSPVSVLIRPEQIELRTQDGGVALSGTVLQSDYYGHDCVLRVRLASDAGGRSLTVRIIGDPPLNGSTVPLSVRGPVLVWPSSHVD
jgi:iron(III) transport system ATP-binding protein